MERNLQLYTFHVDFRGGTYCSQVLATDTNNAISKWLILLSENKNEIKYLGENTIKEIEIIMRNPDYQPVPLSGLNNIWYTYFSTRQGSFSIHVIKTVS